MKKLQMICNDTDNPNFATNYQNGVTELLKESIVKAGVKTLNTIEKTKKPEENSNALWTVRKEIVKLNEHCMIKEECARVEKKRWEGCAEEKFQYQKGREIMAHNFSNRCEQLIKKIDNLIKYV